ncbi:MAG: hypothetical protein KAS32_01755 [Candidatus Peribacteraceae bacterium]|nr:hypothetical protein [Candidatus Peribacteraceae bacterium]
MRTITLEIHSNIEEVATSMLESHMKMCGQCQEEISDEMYTLMLVGACASLMAQKLSHEERWKKRDEKLKAHIATIEDVKSKLVVALNECFDYFFDKHDKFGLGADSTWRYLVKIKGMINTLPPEEAILSIFGTCVSDGMVDKIFIEHGIWPDKI